MSTFLLVHGAYHGAWCWYKLRPELEDRGHAVVAPDLPAHGTDCTPPARATLEGYVDRVCERLADCEGPVALVGHSMAGMVITAVAERRPDAVDALVYLTAYLPDPGESMLDQRGEASVVTENFVIESERGVGYVADEALDEAFYGDCSARDRALARSLLRPEPMDPLSTPVDYTDERFGSVRRTYVGCERDRAITPDQQRAMRGSVGVDETLTLSAGHSPFLSVPEATADALTAALGDRE